MRSRRKESPEIQNLRAIYDSIVEVAYKYEHKALMARKLQEALDEWIKFIKKEVK